MHPRSTSSVTLILTILLVTAPVQAIAHDDIETPTEPEPTIPGDTPTEPEPTIPEDTPTVPDPDVSTPTVPDTPTIPDTPTKPDPGLTSTTVTGAAFTVPQSLTDEADQARSAAPSSAPEAFVLADQNTNRLLFVITESTPKRGEATVDGRVIQTEITTEGMEFGVLVADTVEYETSGESVSLSEIQSNPQQYRHDLVQLSTPHQRMSVLTDPDGGSDITAVQTLGRLSSSDPSSIFNQPGTAARDLLSETATDDAPSDLRKTVNNRLGDGVATVSGREAYWSSSAESVHGIVVTPDSAAAKFLTTSTSSGVSNTLTNESAVYLTRQEFDAQSYQSVAAISKNAAAGEVVQFETTLATQRMSVQETLEAASSCKNDLVLVPTPSGPACLKVTNDVLIEAGVAIDTPAQTRENVIPVVGISSAHSDQAVAPRAGTYEVTAEVVTTNQIDDDLPEGKALLIYKTDRTGDLDYAKLMQEQGKVVKTRAEGLKKNLTTQMQFDVSREVVSTQTATEQSPTQNTNQPSPEPDSSNSAPKVTKDPVGAVADTVGSLVSDAADVVSGIL